MTRLLLVALIAAAVCMASAGVVAAATPSVLYFSQYDSKSGSDRLGGDGLTIDVFRPSTVQFFLDYDNDGVSDMNATFGVIGDIPVVGDWGF